MLAPLNLGEAEIVRRCEDVLGQLSEVLFNGTLLHLNFNNYNLVSEIKRNLHKIPARDSVVALLLVDRRSSRL